MSKRTTFCALILASAVACYPRCSQAQQPVDAAAQASPTTPAAKAPVDDAAAESSPVAAETHGHGTGFAAHTALAVKLAEGVDSGHIKNGQTVSATLAGPVKLASGASLPAGTGVELTVIATVPAGKLNAVGEMSLQVASVGKTAVFTDTLTYRGRPGHRDLPDSAPTTGTDAGLAKGATLTFHVQPPPSMASGPPRGTHEGLVNGVSSGDAPPKTTPAGTPPQ